MIYKQCTWSVNPSVTFPRPHAGLSPIFWRLWYFLFGIGGTARCFLVAPTLAMCARQREREKSQVRSPPQATLSLSLHFLKLSSWPVVCLWSSLNPQDHRDHLQSHLSKVTAGGDSETGCQTLWLWELCCSLMAWDCGLRYVFSVSPALQQGPGAGTRDKEDISRLEMVQRLAKDGCRLLHSPLRASERPAEVRCKHQLIHTLSIIIRVFFQLWALLETSVIGLVF